MLPFQNFGGKIAFTENLTPSLPNGAHQLESSFNLNTTSALPSSNLSFFTFPYLNSPATYQLSSVSALPNLHEQTNSALIQFQNESNPHSFVSVFDPTQQQTLFSSFVQSQQLSSQQQSYLQQLPIIPQNFANLLQRSLSQDPNNHVSQPQQYPAVETAFIQPDQIQKSKLRTPSLSQDKQIETKQSQQIQVQQQYSQQPSLDDINRPSTELCIQGGGQEQVLPRSLSDTLARGDVERFEIERTTSDLMVRLKRKLDSSDQIKFVENLTDLKSNPVSNQSSSLCSYRKWKQGDSPLILLKSIGASLNSKMPFQIIPPSERSKRCSIFQDEQRNQSSQQNSDSNKSSKLQTEISEEVLKNTSLKRNLSKSHEIASSYKKDLLDELSVEDQIVISEMKQSKKYNFSKNVIKQFLKVQLKAPYIYQSDSSNAGAYHLNSKPSFEHLLEFRKQLREFIAGSSFNHSAIKRIIQHPYFSLYFKDFLRDHSAEWLAIGKTKYKQEQHIMVEFLQLCIKNPKLLIFLSEHDYCSMH